MLKGSASRHAIPFSLSMEVRGIEIGLIIEDDDAQSPVVAPPWPQQQCQLLRIKGIYETVCIGMGGAVVHMFYSNCAD
jgi:hypothetical protein